MYEKIIIQDYITRIRQIINSNSPDKREQLHRLIHSVRKINNRHLHKCSVNQTVGKLLEPHWMTTVRKFDLQQWQDTAERVWRSTSKILESIPPPEIVLYPGFKRFNGRVYKVDRKPVIGCSPDYPRISNDRNLKVLLAHEYAHFIRWR